MCPDESPGDGEAAARQHAARRHLWTAIAWIFAAVVAAALIVVIIALRFEDHPLEAVRDDPED